MSAPDMLHPLMWRPITHAARLQSDIENQYREREQSYSIDIRDEYVRHFLHDDLVTGAWCS